MQYLLFFVSILVSYLLGSINFAIIFTRMFTKKDVRDYGSGNAGMTNVMRVGGIWPGVLTLVCDALKGVASCLIGKIIVFPYIMNNLSEMDMFNPLYGVFICGLFCLVGHMYPVFFGFRGGKGVATLIGVTAMCNWKMCLVACFIFILVFIITKIISISSIIGTISLPTSLCFFAVTEGMPSNAKWIQVGLMSIIALLIIFMHRSNIVRIIKGEEKKFKPKKGKNNG